MKTIKAIFFVCMFFIVQMVSAQDVVQIAAMKMFKSGNVQEGSTYLSSLVEINIMGEQSNYSNTQAAFILRDFFKNYPVTSFQKVHQGASNEGLTYLVGRYSANTSLFRVYIVIKMIKGNYMIDKIDISRE